MYRVLIVVLAFVALNGCVPADTKPMTEVVNDVNDTQWRRVYGYADRGDLDSLLLYTRDPNPTYRYLVAHGLASVRDKGTLDSLKILLNDPVSEVREAAAYALGQLKDKGATASLLGAFKNEDTLSVNSGLNSTILEAVGKTGSKDLLKSMATISTYRKSDTNLLLGQARAIYRYALRDMVLPEGTQKMIEFVTDREYPDPVRVMAANYLNKAKDIDLLPFKFQLGQALSKDENPFVRINLAEAIGKTADPEMYKVLQNHWNTEKDDRVRVAILKAYSYYPYIKMINPVLVNLGSKNPHLAQTAADLLIAKGNKNDASIYRNFVNDTLHYSINAKIYGSVLKNTPVYYTVAKRGINKELLRRYESAEDVYEKKAYLDALGYDSNNYKEIGELLDSTSNPILKSTGIEALDRMMKSESFKKAHWRNMRSVKANIAGTLQKQIVDGDAGAIAAAGLMLSEEELDFASVIDSTAFIQTALEKLSLPRETESYKYLKKAQSVLEGTPYIDEKPKMNHPIDFGVFATHGDSTIAAVKTNKGVFRIALYSTKTPGTVASFLQLVDQDFYDGKLFHRVVPNFVIQTGCPRGDGYGSVDYTIRSEVGESYYDDEGYVGMASAGPDTEASQWFVTHVPTPHLDGRYTIFGKVVDGMDVVHAIEVGDKIQDIIITKQ